MTRPRGCLPGEYKRIDGCYPPMERSELRASRYALNLSVRKAAARFGVSSSAWSMYEMGHRSIPGWLENAVRRAIVPDYDPEPPPYVLPTPVISVPQATAEHLQLFCQTFGLTPEMGACLTRAPRKDFLNWYHKRTIPPRSFLVILRRLIRNQGPQFLHWAGEVVTTHPDGSLDYRGQYLPRSIFKQLLHDWTKQHKGGTP